MNSRLSRFKSKAILAAMVTIFAGQLALSANNVDDTASEIARLKTLILAIAQSEVESVNASKEVFGHDFITLTHSIPIYCYEQCACLSNHILKVLHEALPNLGIRIILLRSANGLGLKMKSMDQRFTENFDYHEAVEVSFSGQYFVIDALLESSLPLTLMDRATWLSHFSNFEVSYLK